MFESFVTPEDLLTIDEVLANWGKYFTKNELRKAMRIGEISYLKKGRMTLLTRPAINEYLSNHTVKACQKGAKKPSSNSADIGLDVNGDQARSIDTGMTREAKELAAEALALTILKRPKPS